MTRPVTRQRLAALVGGGAAFAASAASAQTVLIDFGADSTYRGASVVNPDANGNHWTSVDSAFFYTDIVGIDGVPTDVDFGFSAAAGTDSYNGPAAGPDGTGVPADAVYSPTALGDLAADAAVYDYYVNSAFQVQGLDPAKTYDVTFFGSHKYNSDNTTRYTAYDADPAAGPANVIDSVDLVVGVDAAHNEDMVAQLTGLSPDVNGIIYIGFLPAGGSPSDFGYLNAMKVAEVADIAFPVQPLGMVVDPGGMLMFDATVNSTDPNPTYQWQKDGVDLVDDGRITGATTPSLSIAMAGSADIGEYKLVVSITGGASAESTVVVGGVRPSNDRYDVDGNGVVDFFDLADLLNVL
jgi:hypothetical protein